MKKIKILIFCIISLFGVMEINVKANLGDSDFDICNCRDNLCSNCGEKTLFTICNKRSKDCVGITTVTINNNQKYDLFEIKDKEIYLDNSEITLEFNNIWSLLNYKIHISGTNKIAYLNSFNGGKLYPSLEGYQDLYSKDYIPFTVVGDGSLEIVTSNQIKKNAEGETYYKCWTYNFYEPPCLNCGPGGATVNNSPSDIDIKYLNNSVVYEFDEICLTEIKKDNKTVTYTIPKYGYTVSDLKRIFGSNADSFYIARVGWTQSINEFTDFPSSMLKEKATENDDILTESGRIRFIEKLVNNNSTHALPYTAYLNPRYIIFEETQITASWGEANIQTSLPRSFSKTGSYLINFPEEKNMVTTTKTGNIVFESNNEFDPNYHLVVDDITENITDIQSLSVQSKTDKTLVELYDIYMADENNNIVKMEDGTYTIKVELNDTLKKYEGYEVIYISEDNKVELIDARVDGNYIVFNTTHLSKYGVVGREIKKTGNIITNPQTADSVVTYGLAFASLAVAVALVVLRIRKLKETN